VAGKTSAVDELAALLVSRGKLDLRMENKERSICSLGDSYAFGIAGTGGTSSSAAAELCMFLGFGVGRRHAEKLWLNRGCKDPVEVRIELKLVLDDTESPEL
jgi:hypothetical protein